MTDVLSKLPHLSWRGIVVPIMGEATARFAHGNVAHKFIYKDGELVESTGAQNWTFSYTIPFRQDIAKGPYRNLYTVTLPDFILACRDGSAGELIDPDLGQFRAKPTDLTRTLDPNKRDGADVRVEFVHAPDQADEVDLLVGLPNLASIKNEAGALDLEALRSDWEQEPSPEPSADPLSAIDGLGQQILFQADRVANKLDDTAFRLEKLEKTIDKLENPQLWPLRRSSRRLRGSIARVAEKGQNPGQRVIVVINRYERTLSAVAAEAGMTVQQLLELNPAFAALGIVPANGTVRRYG